MSSAFAENLRLTREELGWSQGELSRRLTAAGIPGFHQTTVARLENGGRPVKLDEAYALAEVLGTTVDYLAGKGEKPTYPQASPATLDALDRAITELASIRSTLGDNT